MKKLKQTKGITLIALVITIIVLLILAAVSIATLTGENGILSRATKAGNRTTEETEKEELKLSYNAAKSKKYEEGDYTGEITAEDLKEELEKQNPKAQVKEGSSPIEVTYPNGHEYTVENNGEITGPGKTLQSGEEKLAKDVLKINPDAGEDVPDYERSPYVTYDGITCRVLYNDEYDDEKHGLQIITADAIDTWLSLGEEDESVSKSDFIYDGKVEVDDSFRKAAASYNNLVDTLNNKAKEYISEADKTATKKIAIDARCIGGIATLKNGKFQGDAIIETNYTNDYEYFDTFNNKFKDPDTNYEEDVEQMKKLEIDPESVNDSWLASRCISKDEYGTEFGAYTIGHYGFVREDHFGRVRCDYGTSSYSSGPGFCAVFLLSSDLKILNGDGQSKDTAYELGI